MDTISVIIPVYRVEAYLRPCVDSVLAQSWSRLEILLIDDGSPDRCGAICDEYAAADSRVRVIHQPNGGLSVARNAGLDAASGNYVAFVDSDDRISRPMLEALWTLCRAWDADIAVSPMFIGEPRPQPWPETVTLLTPDAFMPLILQDKLSSHCCNKLFRRTLFDGIRFPPGYAAQDMMTLYRVFDRARRVVLTDRRYYVYNAGRPDSISNHPAGAVRGAVHRSIAFAGMYEFARERYPGAAGEALRQAVSFGLGGYLLRLRLGERRWDGDIDRVLAFFRGRRREILRSPRLGLTRRMAAALLPGLDRLLRPRAWNRARPLAHRMMADADRNEP